ncbi:MAG: lysophospholipid acyltransferase family protein [Eubacteriales bacterium]|jgi:1-acyl-sn-glycerol-3-phosphate acyltransferase
MVKDKNKKVFYYDDELCDDFAGLNIKRCTVDKNFRYLRNSLLWRLCSLFLYYFVAYPIVWFYMRVLMRVRFVNKEAVRQCGKNPYFLYGNHTGFFDAFTPNLISFPRRNKIIVAADTVSIKGIKNLVQMLGAVPIPTDISGIKNFVRAVDTYHKSHNITIYPEAHICPYYNGIRPFSDASFGYAIRHNSPVIAFFTAYSKPKGFLSWLRKANITFYVSNPLYPDEGLAGREARKNLRDKVYNFMLEKSKHSNYEVVKYIRREKERI